MDFQVICGSMVGKNHRSLASSGTPALAQMFSCEFCNIFKNTFSYRTPPVAASEHD